MVQQYNEFKYLYRLINTSSGRLVSPKFNFHCLLLILPARDVSPIGLITVYEFAQSPSTKVIEKLKAFNIGSLCYIDLFDA